MEIEEVTWKGWPKRTFPAGEHHQMFWSWIWSIEKGVQHPPAIFVFPRASGKSTLVELSAVVLAARRICSNGIYVSSSQDMANKRIYDIFNSFISCEHYTDTDIKEGSPPTRGRNGVSRIAIGGDFEMFGIGLDTIHRGLMLETLEPDLIIFEDVDEIQDTPRMTDRKSSDLAHILSRATKQSTIFGIQNLLIPNGIFSRLVDGDLYLLPNREIFGPIPAVRGLQIETRSSGGSEIVGGEATWEGNDLQNCQRLIDMIGLRAFLSEYQHDFLGGSKP